MNRRGFFASLFAPLIARFAPKAEESSPWAVLPPFRIRQLHAGVYWALDSENFANEDTAGKDGLTSFPYSRSLGVAERAAIREFYDPLWLK